MNTLSYTKDNQHITIAMQENEQGNIAITRTIYSKLHTLSVAIKEGETIYKVIAKINNMIALSDDDFLRLCDVYANSIVEYSKGDTVIYEGIEVIVLEILSNIRVRIVDPIGNYKTVHYSEIKLKPL